MPNDKEAARVRAFDKWLAATPTTGETLADAAASGAEPPDYRRDPEFVAELLRGQLGQAVRAAMEETGVTAGALAKALGWKRRRVVGMLDEGDNVSLDDLARIACALDREACVALHRKDEKVAVVPLEKEPRPDPVFFSTPLSEGGMPLLEAWEHIRTCVRCGTPVRVNGTCPQCLPSAGDGA